LDRTVEAAGLEDILLHLQRSMSFHTVEHLDEVLELALVGGLKVLEAMPIVDGKKPCRGGSPPAAQVDPRFIPHLALLWLEQIHAVHVMLEYGSDHQRCAVERAGWLGRYWH
jgi:hypothetical protein